MVNFWGKYCAHPIRERQKMSMRNSIFYFLYFYIFVGLRKGIDLHHEWQNSSIYMLRAHKHATASWSLSLQLRLEICYGILYHVTDRIMAKSGLDLRNGIYRRMHLGVTCSSCSRQEPAEAAFRYHHCQPC